jgi:predicted permease
MRLAMFGFPHAARALLRTPAVTTVAVLSLAFSIGANIAAFSVLNALLFRTVAVPRPHDLVAIAAEARDYADTRLPIDVFRHIAHETTLFSGVLAWQGDYPVLNLEANGVRASTVAKVAGDYFATLGIRPYLGRFFSASERDPVAVIDYRCWERRFARDPSVIGKSIAVEDFPRTIVGVTPPEFTGLEVEVAPEVTIPLDPTTSTRMAVVARLRPGVTLAAARARLEALWQALSVDPPRRLGVQPFARGFSFFRQRQVPTLALLLALASAVLLIACLNVNLLTLARAAARQHELGIRIALGAGRARLVRGLLAEALLLTAGGGALGLVFAAWASHWLVAMLWTGVVPTAIDPSPDVRVFAFAAALSLAAALLFGIAPARAMFRLAPADALRAAPRTTAGGGARTWRLLAAAQIALSVALVFSALVIARSLHDTRSADLGFRRDRLLMVRLFPRTGEPIPGRAVYYRRLAEEIQRIPAVESVTYSGIGPGAPGDMMGRFGDIDAAVDFAGPAFFRSIGVRILAGREFTWSDDEHATPVAIVSAALAARLFPSASPIGRELMFDGRSTRIVGMVAEARLWNPRRRRPVAAYFPVLQDSDANGFWMDIRAARDPAALATPVRRAVDSLGRHTALRIQTLEERLDATLARERMAASVAAFLAGLAVFDGDLRSHGTRGGTPHAGVRRPPGGGREPRRPGQLSFSGGGDDRARRDRRRNPARALVFTTGGRLNLRHLDPRPRHFALSLRRRGACRGGHRGGLASCTPGCRHQPSRRDSRRIRTKATPPVCTSFAEATQRTPRSRLRPSVRHPRSGAPATAPRGPRSR